MIETLTELLKGKPTIIKNVQYLSASSYIQPFLDYFSEIDVDFICNVKQADQMSVTENSPDVIYNRVNIQAIIPNTPFNNVIGLIYGLDTRKPVAKLYRGLIDSNGNYISFDKNNLSIQEIEEGLPLNLSFVEESLQLFNDKKQWDGINNLAITSLEESIVSYVDLPKMLGEWIDKSLSLVDISDFGKVKLATSIPINGYKYIIKDKASPYFTETDTNRFNVYTALLQALSDEEDIINVVEKTHLINNLLNI